jgi:SAM-dependent methyltransferase
MRRTSRELGLLLLQQLLRLDELHYGLWDNGLAPALGNLPLAQRRYTELLLAALCELAPPPRRVLDVGCGAGALLAELRALGDDAEGVSPAPGLTRLARERLARAGHGEVRLFECRFEDFPAARRAGHYDVVVFSESFQYIALPAALERAEEILRPGGHVLICDFFRSAAHGDAGPADDTFGGGHPIAAFYEAMARSRLTITRDVDLTARVAPTLAIADEILMSRLLPASEILARHLAERRPWLYRALRLVGGRRLEKLRRKYFSGHRTPETFARYKTYRLITARLTGGHGSARAP